MNEHEERQDERQIGAEPGGYDNPFTRERSSEEEKVEVKVGGYSADGTFLGEVLRFTAEGAGSWTDYAMATSRDDRGVTYTLYKLPGDPDARYRVHELTWSNWQGEGSEAFLHPVDQDEEDEEVTYAPGEALTYGAYSEDAARQEWPHIFAALGMPNCRDIDLP